MRLVGLLSVDIGLLFSRQVWSYGWATVDEPAGAPCVPVWRSSPVRGDSSPDGLAPGPRPGSAWWASSYPPHDAPRRTRPARRCPRTPRGPLNRPPCPFTGGAALADQTQERGARGRCLTWGLPGPRAPRATPRPSAWPDGPPKKARHNDHRREPSSRYSPDRREAYCGCHHTGRQPGAAELFYMLLPGCAGRWPA
jgi:hypothetical protein